MKDIFYILAVVFILFGCEEKPVVIPEFETIETGKVVLVEELTGVECPNCPAGSARLASVQLMFPKNMVLVAIHGIDLTKPLEESKYDFRNQDASDLEVFLKKFLGKPSAYFNRVRFDELGEDWGNAFIGQWEGYIRRELEKEQVLSLSITKEYDFETRQLSITVGALPLKTMNGEFKLSVLLTESDIEDAQDDQFTVLEDYIHNHVLRDVITTFNGDFFANTLTENEVVSKKYTYTIPDEDGLWVPTNLEIVAFVAKTDGESEEVLQAGQVHLLD